MRSVKQTVIGRTLCRLLVCVLLLATFLPANTLAKVYRINGSSSTEGDPTDGLDYVGGGGGGGIFEESKDSQPISESTDTTPVAMHQSLRSGCLVNFFVYQPVLVTIGLTSGIPTFLIFEFRVEGDR